MPMLDVKQLFSVRLKAHVLELSRYLRYILTGHLAIAMVFILGALSVYYHRWLDMMPEEFPSEWLMAVIFGFVAVYAPIQTFLKKADLVFLIPAEYRLKGFFLRAILYSFFTQLYLLVLAVVALAPLYFQTFSDYTGKELRLLFVLLIVLKIWAFVVSWWMHKVRDASTRKMEGFLRFFLVTVLIFFFMQQEIVYTIIVTVLLIGLWLVNIYFAKQNNSVNWELLIEQNYRRKRAFYRLANMFTDVPHLETQVKKRRILATLLTKSIALKKESTFLYLFRLTTVRSTDYLGIFLRLLVIGLILVWTVPNAWLMLVFGLLFMYVIFLQMLPLYRHHRLLVWIDLYPIKVADRMASFTKWIRQMMLFTAILFVIPFLIEQRWLEGAIMIGASLLFIYMILPSYIQKKYSKE